PGVGDLQPFPYLVFDTVSWGQWWKLLLAEYVPGSPTMGQNAPPLFFVKPAILPPDIVILPPTIVPPHGVSGFDGPVGAPEPGNPGVYADATPPGQSFNDLAEYDGPTGKYIYH